MPLHSYRRFYHLTTNNQSDPVSVKNELYYSVWTKERVRAEGGAKGAQAPAPFPTRRNVTIITFKLYIKNAPP